MSLQKLGSLFPDCIPPIGELSCDESDHGLLWGNVIKELVKRLNGVPYGNIPTLVSLVLGSFDFEYLPCDFARQLRLG